MEINKELFIEATQEFADFIEKGNDKVILSGKYGSGKTTFLKTFFNARKDQFEVFRIAPVNYSITHNEDIIDLIKYDIITEFLSKEDIEIHTLDIPSIDLITSKDIRSIFFRLLTLIDIKGIKLNDVMDELKKLKDSLDERRLQKDEQDQFIKFLEEVESKKGVFERDLISLMIRNVLKRINQEKNKQCVLIIDDIDRIDPEHIFRILNVFSAHFDNEIFDKQGLKNKFGFDKVILVCDYKNIESIFYNKYGLEADFSGYIDKFYTSSIYQFDIKNRVAKIVIKALFTMDEQVVAKFESELNYFRSSSREFFIDTILNSVLIGEITIRTLSKLQNINVENYFNKLENNIDRYSSLDSRRYTLFLIKLNLFLFGNSENLIRCIERLSSLNVKLQIDKHLLTLIYNIEYSYQKPSGSGKPMYITTKLNEFEFEVKKDSYNMEEVSIFLKDAKGFDLHNSHVIDIIKHLFGRLTHLNQR